MDIPYARGLLDGGPRDSSRNRLRQPANEAGFGKGIIGKLVGTALVTSLWGVSLLAARRAYPSKPEALGLQAGGPFHPGAAWSLPESRLPKVDLAPTQLASAPAARALRLFVPEVPEEFASGVTGAGRVETDKAYGLRSLGNVESPEYDQWQTHWANVDLWYINQALISPLRTDDPARADLFIVPAVLQVLNAEQHASFISKAPSLFPYLGRKPHVVVLNHAPKVFNDCGILLKHDNAKHFTFVTLGYNPPPVTPGDITNLVATPQFSTLHWSLGAPQLRNNDKFNVTEVVEQKEWLAAQSFNVRDYPDRSILYFACMELPERCIHRNYTDTHDIVPAHLNYRAAWYGPQPQADFVARSGVFDTLLAGAIPVVFNASYSDAMPFTDVLDYRRLLVYIPSEQLMGGNAISPLTHLAENFNFDAALQRLRYIYKVRALFNYLVNPDHGLLLWGEQARLHPRDDAFTFTLKAVMRNACQRGYLRDRCRLTKG